MPYANTRSRARARSKRANPNGTKFNHIRIIRQMYIITGNCIRFEMFSERRCANCETPAHGTPVAAPASHCALDKMYDRYAQHLLIYEMCRRAPNKLVDFIELILVDWTRARDLCALGCLWYTYG